MISPRPVRQASRSTGPFLKPAAGGAHGTGRRPVPLRAPALGVPLFPAGRVRHAQRPRAGWGSRPAPRRPRRHGPREPPASRPLSRPLRVFADDGCLPITYPHVLAMPLQFAILTHPRFVVRLMGLVHVANDIQQSRPLPDAGPVELRSWIEGHRDVDRGHEFDLFTAVEDGQGTAWIEKSTLLARRAVKRQVGRARRAPGAALRECRRRDRSPRPSPLPCPAPWAGATAGCPAT